MLRVNTDIHGNVDPDELLMLVDKALLKVLDPDKVVGFCLSGGLDSTTLVKLGERYGPVETFSTVFPGTSVDESKYVIDALDDDIIAHVIVPPPPTLKDIEKLIKIQGGPFPSLSLYVQYKLIEEASKYVEVLIDGQGPDELLCGYIGYQLTYIRELWQRKYYSLAIKEAMYSFKNHWKVLIKALQTVGSTDQFEGGLAEVLDRDLSTSLDVELDWLRKTARYFDVKVKSPYTDPYVMQWCMNLPYDMKIRNGTSKWALRQATRGLLPESIRTRQNKLGFPSPEPEWMKNELQQLVLDNLDPFSIEYDLYMDYIENKRPYDRRVWQKVCDTIALRV